jgi:hypothetical protein
MSDNELIVQETPEGFDLISLILRQIEAFPDSLPERLGGSSRGLCGCFS